MNNKKAIIDLLPNGKTVLPAKIVINKMGSSIIMSLAIDLKKALKSSSEKEDEEEIGGT